MKAIIQPLNLKGFSSIDLLSDDIDCQDLGFILSEPERNNLKAFKMLCSTPSLILEQKYKKIAIDDTESYVFENNYKGSFHTDKACKNLSSDFEDYSIPEKIRGLGSNAVANYREFFTENFYLLKSGLTKDVEIFEMRVGVKFKVNNISIAVKYENSGYDQIDNINLGTIKSDILALLLEAEEFKNSNETRRKQIQNCSNGMHRTELCMMADVKITGTSLYQWAAYKKALKNLITTYFMVKFNVNCGFNKRLLEELNFKKCSVCCH